MRKVFVCLIGLTLILGASLAQAEQKFNPFSGQWETTYPESQLRYNPMDGTWQYLTPRPAEPTPIPVLPVPQFPRLEFNPFNGKWEFPR